LVWFVVALFAGNASNLASGDSLSTTIYCKAENKFSLFSCQARNPSNHKGFPRLHAKETIGKYFPAARNTGKIRRIKSQAMAAKQYKRSGRSQERIDSEPEAIDNQASKQGKQWKEGRKEGIFRKEHSGKEHSGNLSTPLRKYRQTQEAKLWRLRRSSLSSLPIVTKPKKVSSFFSIFGDIRVVTS
jgi:hypothetical protein